MVAVKPRLTIPADLTGAYDALARDLRAVFGPRLDSAVAFGPRLRGVVTTRHRKLLVQGDTLVLVDHVTMDDLVACSAHADRWHRGGLRMPLLLGRSEFLRSLDAFPLEYDDIIAHHVTLVGDDPFANVIVRAEDLRRACEARAKGHLVHLREGYLEARGRPGEIANLILSSASPFSALLGNLARLLGKDASAPEQRAVAVAAIADAALPTVMRVLTLELEPILGADEAVKLYPDYLAVIERLVAWVDGWSRL
jgi:hypothetical protein